jgi:hypothetical protein
MKQQPTLTSIPERMPGEGARDYERRLAAFLAGEDVRTRTDLRDWTGSLPFHLNREPA